MLIWTNFDRFAITYLIEVAWFKNLVFLKKLCLIICKHKRTWNEFSGLSFWWIFFFCNTTKTGHILLPDCIYFASYSVKCISCFKFRHLMTSNLIFLRTKRLLKWNKKHFFWFDKCFCLDLKIKLANM